MVYRWDLDYDGVWDVESAGDPVTTTVFEKLGRHVVKLEVEDSAGWTAATLLAVEVTEEPIAEPIAELSSPDVAQPAPDLVISQDNAASPDSPITTDVSSAGSSKNGGGSCAAGSGGPVDAGLVLFLLLASMIVLRRARQSSGTPGI